ncbi:hypothetical protein OAL25_00135 [bacterium]|nr:hypothetical protein [bacterium]
MAITITSTNPSPTSTVTVFENSTGPNLTITAPLTTQTGVLEPTNFSGEINVGGVLYADLSPADYGGDGGAAPVPLSYTLSKTPTGTINEGGSVSITLTASDGSTTPFTYTITGVSSPDFNPTATPTSGTATLGTAIPFTFNNDLTTEGTETMTFAVPSTYPADGSGGSGQNITVTVGDTSTSPSPGGGGGTGPFFLPGGTSYTQSPYITNPNSTHSIANTWYRRGIVRFNYPQAECTTVGLTGSTTINSCSWYLNSAPNRPVAPQFTIAMGPTPNTATTNSSAYIASTINYGPTPYAWSGTGAKTFTFSTPFTYPGSGGIQMNVTWGQVTPNYNASGTIRLRAPGRQYYQRTDGSGSYPISSSANQSYTSGRPITQLGV